FLFTAIVDDVAVVWRAGCPVPGPVWLALAGLLDLDHLGAEVGHDRGRDWAGDKAREVDNPEAGQRMLPFHSFFFPRHSQYWMRRVMAPSTTRLAPLMRLARGLARKTAALATSSGRPIRPIGFSASIVLATSGSSRSRRCHPPPAKYIVPVQSVLARTPFGPSSRASPLT